MRYFADPIAGVSVSGIELSSRMASPVTGRLPVASNRRLVLLATSGRTARSEGTVRLAAARRRSPNR